MAIDPFEPAARNDNGAVPMHRWIKTACGRAKYAELAARPGVLARLRLAWFVAIAALRDWRLNSPDQLS